MSARFGAADTSPRTGEPNWLVEPSGCGEPSGVLCHPAINHQAKDNKLLQIVRNVCILLAVVFTTLSIISWFANLGGIQGTTSTLGFFGFAFGMTAYLIMLKTNRNRGLNSPKNDSTDHLDP